MILRRVQQSLACFVFEESVRCEEHACTSCLTLAQLELGGNSINEVSAVRGVNSCESINIALISSSRSHRVAATAAAVAVAAVTAVAVVAAVASDQSSSQRWPEIARDGSLVDVSDSGRFET